MIARLAFLVATRHSKTDLEIDWLMVDPAYHGTGIADVLISCGLLWLGLPPRLAVRGNGEAG